MTFVDIIGRFARDPHAPFSRMIMSKNWQLSTHLQYMLKEQWSPRSAEQKVWWVPWRGYFSISLDITLADQMQHVSDVVPLFPFGCRTISHDISDSQIQHKTRQNMESKNLWKLLIWYSKALELVVLSKCGQVPWERKWLFIFSTDNSPWDVSSSSFSLLWSCELSDSATAQLLYDNFTLSSQMHIWYRLMNIMK